MKTYISAAGLLIAGILVAAATIILLFPTQQFLGTNTTAFSPQEQSSFVTSTTSLGDAPITEILVNTSIQFPIGDRTILPTSIRNSVQIYALIVLLCISTLMIGLLLYRHT